MGNVSERALGGGYARGLRRSRLQPVDFSRHRSRRQIGRGEGRRRVHVQGRQDLTQGYLQKIPLHLAVGWRKAPASPEFPIAADAAQRTGLWSWLVDDSTKCLQPCC